jgi:hypothetical protein
MKYILKLLGIIAMAAIMGFSMTACGDDGTSDSPPHTGGGGTSGGFVPVTSITAIPTTGTVGTGLTLTGTVNPSNATNRNITWSIVTAGSTGATITGGNTLRATSAGTVTVRATINNGLAQGSNYTRTATITFSGAFVPVTGIINVPSLGTVGTPHTLTGTVTPENATNKTIVWTIENAGSTGATISGNQLRATSAGGVVIRATIRNGRAPGSDWAGTATINFRAPDGGGSSGGVTAASLRGTTWRNSHQESIGLYYAHAVTPAHTPGDFFQLSSGSNVIRGRYTISGNRITAMWESGNPPNFVNSNMGWGVTYELINNNRTLRLVGRVSPSGELIAPSPGMSDGWRNFNLSDGNPGGGNTGGGNTGNDTATQRPAPPTGISVTGWTSNSIQVTWLLNFTGPTAATSYRLDFSAQGMNGPWTSAGTNNTGRAIITGLLPNTMYWVRVTAVNNHGQNSSIGTGRTRM